MVFNPQNPFLRLQIVRYRTEPLLCVFWAFFKSNFHKMSAISFMGVMISPRIKFDLRVERVHFLLISAYCSSYMHKSFTSQYSRSLESSVAFRHLPENVWFKHIILINLYFFFQLFSCFSLSQFSEDRTWDVIGWCTRTSIICAGLTA